MIINHIMVYKIFNKRFKMSKKSLENLYNNAIEVSFDGKDRIVFISDIHRGDGTYYDALLPNRNIYLTALKRYLRNGYTYVEVGDGDELWKNKNFFEIAYAYEEIFKVLNKFVEKDKIYLIYGNHDIIKKNSKFKIKEKKYFKKTGADYGKEFLDFIDKIQFYEGINFLYTPVKEKFLVTHGNQVDFTNSELICLSRFLVRYIWKFMYGIAGFRDPTSSAKSKNKRSLVDFKLQSWARDHGTMIICGHTHNSNFPGVYEPPYFNDGCCVLPDSITAIEIDGGFICLVKWYVSTDEDGRLIVKKKVIGGPEKIEGYLLWAKEERVRLSRLKEEERRNKKKK